MESRRGFFRRALGVAAGLLLLPAGRAWGKKLALPLDKVPKLEKVGGWMVVKIKGRQVLLVRDGKDSIRALNPTCTHQQCLVGYEPKTGKIECDCHQSHFDLDGKNLDGPAPEPLTTYPASLSGGRIIIELD
jgi:cytochrome b6-f complex iron-sulfur subunit